MKKLLLAATMLAGSVALASAADLPSRKEAPVMPAPVLPVMTWSGFYVGGNIGYGWMENFNTGSVFNPLQAAPSGGVVGGAQIGYNFQISPWLVAGLETDFQGSSVGGGVVARHTPWFGTVRARIGVTPFSPNLMLYGTGGFAYGRLNIGPFPLGQTYGVVGTGWTVGGGLEYALSPNWSVKAEYLYTDIGGNFPTGPLFSSRNEAVHEHLVRLGVNYRFNWGAPGAVVARY